MNLYFVFSICVLNTFEQCYSRRFHVTESTDKPVTRNWSAWSPCAVQGSGCGNGTQFRSQRCEIDISSNALCREIHEIRNCSLPCPVNGNWTNWGQWGACNITCGNGTQIRKRSCSSPAPLYGGKNCSGEREQVRDCQVSCSVDGNWSSWGNWGQCQPFCGNGHHMRTRTCTNPAPKHKGKHCIGPGTEVQTCYLKPCPGDCDFEKGFCGWKNTKYDIFDWTRMKGRTPSTFTGPSFDHTTGRGFYVYAEASWPRKKGHIAKFFSPQLRGVWCMRFFYSMYGRDMGDLQVFLHHEKRSLETFVWARYKNQGLRWHSANATVYGYNGGHFNVSFVSRVGPRYTSDIALDDISFVPGTCNGEILDFLNKNKTGQDVVTDIETKNGEPGSCHFDGRGRNNLCGWINEAIDDTMDWVLTSGSTSSRGTGPSFDHSTGINGTGKYLYIEATSKKGGSQARLLSPRLCGKYCMQFYYHMYGDDIGKLNVYHRHGLKEDDKVWSVSGNQGDNWLEALISFNGDCYKIVLEGTVTGGFRGDIAIDNVFLTKGSCCALSNRLFDAGREGNCSFDDGFGPWSHKKTDVDFQWSLGNGSTLSAFTGPSSDFSGYGQYAFIESSEPQMIGNRASIVSKVLRGLQCMRFKYHMYGETVGSLTVYRFGNGLKRAVVWKRKGNYGNLWNDAAITFLCNVTAYRVEIEAIVAGWSGDIAIDNIEFTPGKCPKISPKVAAVIKPTPASIHTSTSTINGNCSFPGHFCSWINAEDDNGDWLLHQGKTLTDDTGPNSDYDGGGYYIYTEASLSKPGDTARLVIENMSGQLCMQFFYHMHTFGVGKLYVEIFRKSHQKKSRVLWSKHGNQGFNWKKALVDLQGVSYMIGIVSVRGKSFQGDIAIDTISFRPGKCSGRAPKGKVVSGPHSKVPASAFILNNCNFDKGFCKWRNVLKDDFDWQVRRGGTPSGGTGPNHDHSGRGMYAYIEASAPRRSSDKARLVRYGSGEACMVFHYNMYGADVGSLKVYQNIYGYDVELWKKEGNKGMQWWKAEVHLSDAPRYEIIFEGIRGRGYRGDIAIDDVSFIVGGCSIQVRRYI